MTVEAGGGVVIPRQLAPIDIRFFVTVTEPYDVETVLKLAEFARDGHGDAMQRALADVALDPNAARTELCQGFSSSSNTPRLRTQLLWLALGADDLGVAARARPTTAAAGHLWADPRYQELESLVQTDLAARDQRIRERDFFTLGRLARIAAGSK